MPETTTEANPVETKPRRTFRKNTSCLTCRRRRVKCNAAKPTCDTCARAKPPAKCEYDTHKTKVQMLYEKIEKLELVIGSLECTELAQGSPTLSSSSSDVVETTARRPSRKSLDLVKRATFEEPVRAFCFIPALAVPRPYKIGIFDHIATAFSAREIWDSDSPTPRYLLTSSEHITPNNLTGLVARPANDALGVATSALRIKCPAGSSGAACRWWEEDDLPQCHIYHLIDLFLRHRHQCGIDFHVPRFLSSLSLPPDKGHHPALIDTMCLIACAFSRTQHLRKHEQRFLSQARTHLAESLAQADRLLDFIRGSALLARYYAFRGRFVESVDAISTCAKFTMACGLHKITSRVWNEHGAERARQNSLLPPPTDSIEVADRMYTFWMVFLIERTGSASDKLVSTFVDDEIETLFPLPISYYEMPPEVISSFPKHTIRDVFNPKSGALQAIRDEWTYNVVVKGTVLFQRAGDLRAVAEAGGPLSSAFWADFWTADGLLETYADNVAVIPALVWENAGGRKSLPSLLELNLAYIHMQMHAAFIQLHEPFAPEGTISHKKCMDSLGSIVQLVRLIEHDDPRHMQPFEIGMRIGHNFLAREIDRRREKGDASFAQLQATRQALFDAMVRIAPFRVVGVPPPRT
ncbi:hypothetical protein BOTBODRAFT_38435 [Botryobasidium botryosum FD-172 SS1]|uniref:Zn(2)-C6 fungal-type domain-containing protein n=1 Tax=Botryobasidium botryosum (strain FD-172 SS1) TaxID=930990 RepID=A0A067LXG7_BOTB1|nr:hypothetical protein BOTBODRAFT_38435 [Botryobasidium botryosum FD-172 SS1]